MVRMLSHRSLCALTTLLALHSGAVMAAGAKRRLSQKDVAELVLKQGPETSEVNDQYLQLRIEPAKILLKYDWNATIESGYEFDKEENKDRIATQGSTYKRYLTNATLAKSFTTGSLINLTYIQKSENADYNFATTPTTTNPASAQSQMPKNTADEFGITFEQSLLNNFFGRADRAAVRSAEKTFSAATVERTDNLEEVVLKTIRQYWATYVAEQTFKEAMSSRDRFKNLVAQVRRKNSVGYANPGELAQSQADFETQEQNVKTSSTEYLKQLEALNTMLGLPLDTQIEFVISEAIPEVPKLNPVNVEELRNVRAQKLRVESADDGLIAARSTRFPAVNLVGKYYTSGFDDTADGSFSRMSSGSHPKYYAGVKVVYNFGSDYQTEEVINKKVTKDLEETRLGLRRKDQASALAQAERAVQSNYAILQSAARQKEFREQAVRDLTRTYSQGRTAIKELIDAINNQFSTEVVYSKAIGNYQTALNEWAAVRDELIPESAAKNAAGATDTTEDSQ